MTVSTIFFFELVALSPRFSNSLKSFETSSWSFLSRVIASTRGSSGCEWLSPRGARLMARTNQRTTSKRAWVGNAAGIPRRASDRACPRRRRARWTGLPRGRTRRNRERLRLGSAHCRRDRRNLCRRDLGHTLAIGTERDRPRDLLRGRAQRAGGTSQCSPAPTGTVRVDRRPAADAEPCIGGALPASSLAAPPAQRSADDGARRRRRSPRAPRLSRHHHGRRLAGRASGPSSD